MLARLANVNKDEITSKTRQALFLIATFCGSARCTPIFKRFGYGGKERGFSFLTLREFPDAPGTHVCIKDITKCILHDRSLLNIHCSSFQQH